ncbi:IS110 family transposase [Salegentibacter sp. F14]
MKEFDFFVGVDVSKATLDFSVVKDGKQVFYKRIENKIKTIRNLLKLISKDHNTGLSYTLFCMEYTGIYNNHLLKYPSEQLHSRPLLIAGQ